MFPYWQHNQRASEPVQWIPPVSRSKGPFVVASQYSDVTGDGVVDGIFLIATKLEDSPYFNNMSLVVQNGFNQEISVYHLKEAAGYNPAIWTGDFTGDYVDDILVTVQSGGSGAAVYAYVFSFISGKLGKIFDAIQFHEKRQYEVKYADNYEAVVTGRNPNLRYVINLLYKGKEYLDEIYDGNGRLKEAIEGWVDPISGTYPVDLRGNGKYSLLTMEKIAGRYHADGLGFVENVLNWNGREFETVMQHVAINGASF
ncbi:VCBS repeat-containing protein [Ureibacillus terrenus]|uniref:VCBS repeat-containing protein n=1 Tax=Ureibacillus terrenus TaxID=118246 RepID=UPI002E1AD095|nr:VCBS repeat-containing protein [Ureibacillus terrenus]